MTDSEREHLIEAYRTILTLEPSFVVKRQAAEAMAELVKGRSPERVRQMERELGIE